MKKESYIKNRIKAMEEFLLPLFMTTAMCLNHKGLITPGLYLPNLVAYFMSLYKIFLSKCSYKWYKKETERTLKVVLKKLLSIL